MTSSFLPSHCTYFQFTGRAFIPTCWLLLYTCLLLLLLSWLCLTSYPSHHIHIISFVLALSSSMTSLLLCFHLPTFSPAIMVLLILYLQCSLPLPYFLSILLVMISVVAYFFMMLITSDEKFPNDTQQVSCPSSII